LAAEVVDGASPLDELFGRSLDWCPLSSHSEVAWCGCIVRIGITVIESSTEPQPNRPWVHGKSIAVVSWYGDPSCACDQTDVRYWKQRDIGLAHHRPNSRAT
jgi:hypothetical protein